MTEFLHVTFPFLNYMQLLALDCCDIISWSLICVVICVLRLWKPALNLSWVVAAVGATDVLSFVVQALDVLAPEVTPASDRAEAGMLELLLKYQRHCIEIDMQTSWNIRVLKDLLKYPNLLAIINVLTRALVYLLKPLRSINTLCISVKLRISTSTLSLMVLWYFKHTASSPLSFHSASAGVSTSALLVGTLKAPPQQYRWLPRPYERVVPLVSSSARIGKLLDLRGHRRVLEIENFHKFHFCLL